VDSIRQSIIERRNRLGWSNKTLAKKSNVPYIVICRMLEGSGCLSGYISQMNSSLNEALESLWIIEKKQNADSKKFSTPTNDNGLKNRKPQKRRCGWSLHYSQCIKCGCSDTPHISRGMCKSCYDKDIEKRHKDNERIQNYGGSSKLLTGEYLIENYTKQNKSLSDIAKKTNCSRQYVHKKLKEYYIPLRSKSAARDLALTKDKLKFERLNEDGTSYFLSVKKINVNEKFFSLWSPAMAYVLGVICTDGNLDPGRIREPWRAKSSSTIPRISISQKEPELLEKIRNLMDCNAKLYFSKERVYGKIKAGALYHFNISNEKLYDDIVSLGLTPNKSLTMQFPNMPNEFVRHFIRGCWDGDGSVYIDKYSGKIGASFVSGSLEFVEALVEKLVNAGLPNRTIYRHSHSNTSHYFKFTGSQVPMLYHHLYDDVPETEYLQRKFNLFHLSLEMNAKKFDKDVLRISI
jgi:predicted DNA-binding protein YlxM (UPF0122 family)